MSKNLSQAAYRRGSISHTHASKGWHWRFPVMETGFVFFLLPIKSMPSTRTIRQFAKYLVVGGLAFVVDFTVLFLLTDQLGLYYLVSASIAFLLGLVTNYLLCIAWIFDYRALNNQAHEFAIFSLIGIAGLLMNNLVMFLLTEFLGLHYLLSKAGAAGLILIFNFSLRRSLLFSERKKTQAETT